MRRLVLGLLLVLAAGVVRADETLVLEDGRQFTVVELVRRHGKVVFQTAAGRTLSVEEDRVVSPPLDEIATEIVVLDDGRRIGVRDLARKGGQVVLQTLSGRMFSVPEARVVSPPLDGIRSLDAVPAPVPTPEPEAAPAPPAPPVEPPAPPAAYDPDAKWAGVEPLPDRWGIAYPKDARFPEGRLLDPYNQNVLKGDRPVLGDDVFVILTGVLDVPIDARRLPAASGVSAERAGSREFFGRGEQLFTSPRAFLSAELFRGQTTFRPRTWAVKATLALDLNVLAARERNLVDIDVREGPTRRRQDAALEEAFAEVKLKDLSPHFDFASARAGIQPFTSDFRGFVFTDQNLGVRLFGNAASNRWQYNLAGFDLLEKETNSELNLLEKRDQRVLVANVFRQDTFAPGHTVLVSFHHSVDDASVHYDANGFLVRPAKIGDVAPHEVRSSYLGVAGDGHLGRLNLTWAAYRAWGEDERQPLAGRTTSIGATFAAVEASVDRDWLRFKASVAFASGDDTPTDDRASGFDAIYDQARFAGGEFSFWTRSGIALTQTGVLLKSPGSLLPSLRSSKFEGQANFVNPGLVLVGVGADTALTPHLSAVAVVNALRFHRTGALDLLLFQPGIRKAIGTDFGLGVLYRPKLNENIVITAGVSGLLPGGGFQDLYSSQCTAAGCGASERTLLSAFTQIKLAY